MPRSNVPSRSRAWPRVAILGLIGIAAAGCSDSARFTSDRVAYRPLPPSDITGSIPHRQASASSVTAQPLPAPPQRTAASRRDYSVGGERGGAYRSPAHERVVARSDYSHYPPSPASTPSSGHLRWNGGYSVVVRRGETLASIARQSHVSVAAIMRANGIRNPSEIQPGQRIDIPRRTGNTQPHVAAAAPRAPGPRASGNVAFGAPGETLIGIARRHDMSLSALARLNHISPYTKLAIGDRVVVPGSHREQVARREAAPAPRHEAPKPAPAPEVAKPRTVPAETVASVPTQSVRVAKAETEPTGQPVTKKAEPAGAMPSFRWPVKGRIIARFGREPNGTMNDGINLAVPEGTPIKAADDGVVAYAGNELKGYGNLVLIRHANGYVSAYANASKLLVTRGEHVKRGQVIARAGQTGNVTSPQLHFEIRKGSTPVDPTKYLGG
jgi:murein DD-endopeptidase MepM/ murein hydrolase activator NlpD